MTRTTPVKKEIAVVNMTIRLRSSEQSWWCQEPGSDVLVLASGGFITRREDLGRGTVIGVEESVESVETN